MSDRQNRSATRQALKQEVIQVDATQHQIGSQRPLSAACDLRLVVETRPPAVRLRIPSKRWAAPAAAFWRDGHSRRPRHGTRLHAQGRGNTRRRQRRRRCRRADQYNSLVTETSHCAGLFARLWTSLLRGASVLARVGVASATVGGKVGSRSRAMLRTATWEMRSCSRTPWGCPSTPRSTVTAGIPRTPADGIGTAFEA